MSSATLETPAERRRRRILEKGQERMEKVMGTYSKDAGAPRGSLASARPRCCCRHKVPCRPCWPRRRTSSLRCPCWTIS